MDRRRDALKQRQHQSGDEAQGLHVSLPEAERIGTAPEAAIADRMEIGQPARRAKPQARAAPSAFQARLRGALSSRTALRQAMLLNEILGRPKALRGAAEV